MWHCALVGGVLMQIVATKYDMSDICDKVCEGLNSVTI